VSATGREALQHPRAGRPWDEALHAAGANWGTPGNSFSLETHAIRRALYAEPTRTTGGHILLSVGHGTWTHRFGMSGFSAQAWEQGSAHPPGFRRFRGSRSQ